jgi:hypothetical protein
MPSLPSRADLAALPCSRLSLLLLRALRAPDCLGATVAMCLSDAALAEIVGVLDGIVMSDASDLSAEEFAEFEELSALD